MKEKNDTQKHYNLYYIFHLDKQFHPIPPPFLQVLRQKIEEILRLKT